MSNEMIQLPTVPTPLPQIDINVRAATMDDLAFIDALQKKHTKMVGFMPTKQFEGKINSGHVLVAEEVVGGRWLVAGEETSSPATSHQSPATRLGYCIGNDQYFKHDDIGIIYQMNVVPGRQRGLIGATLLKAQFERSAYGCKLYCCWCAQDIAANKFWEAMGFVPLAFRAGSREKSRVHIFWQKRIRAGDVTTPWWFPSQTSGGSIREDRLVLPIPPGTKWDDEMPRILPTAHRQLPTDKQLPTADCRLSTSAKTKARQLQAPRSRCHFVPPGEMVMEPARQAPVEIVRDKPKKQKVKNDPKFVAAARELRDRYLEQVNNAAPALPGAVPNVAPSVAPAVLPRGRYDVSRQFSAPRNIYQPRLPEAA